MKPAVCALVSGGLDSCAMLADLARHYRRIHPVFVREGLIWEAAELRALRRFRQALPAALRNVIAPPVVLALPVRDLYGQHWSTTGRRTPSAATPDQAVYLPGRNLLLLAKAAVFCATHRIPVIAIGSLGHNPFPDATPRFLRDFARTAGAALQHRLRIIAPFRRLTKMQVIRRHQQLPLHLTFSCIAPRAGRHCGRCNKCAERQCAIAGAGLTDKTRYATHAHRHHPH